MSRKLNKPSSKPLILNFYEFNEEHQKFLLEVFSQFKINCNVCKHPIKVSIRVTSNWITHLRLNHPATYQNYVAQRKEMYCHNSVNTTNRTTSNINNYVKTGLKYCYANPIQKKIDNQLVRLIVNTSMSLSIIDHYDFKLFLHLLNKQYRVSSRLRLTYTLIPNLHQKLVCDLKKQLDLAQTVTVTLDAWTDPRMRAFLAITDHIISDNWEPKTYLLDCIRFKDRHLSSNIKEMYNEIIKRYGIENKVTHIVTDNAANMVCAFKKVSLLSSDVVNDIYENTEPSDSILESKANEEVDFDPDVQDTLDDLTESESTDSDLFSNPTLNHSIFNSISNGSTRISCIAHTLQLVIKDALTDVSSVERAIENVARLICSTNKSYLLKEKIESLDKFFVKRNETRWSSQFNMIRSFLNFTEDELEMIFGRKNVITNNEKVILSELVMVLEDFSVITELIQTDKFSIGHIIPLIRGLKKELNKLPRLKHCERIKLNLLSSLEKRFGYLEDEPIYALAAILTPKYGKRWLDEDELNKWDDELINQMQEYNKRFPLINDQTNQNETYQSILEQSIAEPKAKKIKCLSYLNDNVEPKSQSKRTLEQSLKEYFSCINSSHPDELDSTGEF